jgi:hypothetical protein
MANIVYKALTNWCCWLSHYRENVVSQFVLYDSAEINLQQQYSVVATSILQGGTE